MTDTVTITGNTLAFVSFGLLIFFHVFAWLVSIRNFKNRHKWEKKREELKKVQYERDQVISKMLNYKLDTGYSFKPEMVEEHTKLAEKEIEKMKELEKIL